MLGLVFSYSLVLTVKKNLNLRVTGKTYVMVATLI